VGECRPVAGIEATEAVASVKLSLVVKNLNSKRNYLIIG